MKVFVWSHSVAALSAFVYGQESKLTANEVNKITNAAYARLRNESHRVSYTDDERSKIGSEARRVIIREVTYKQADGSFHSIRRTAEGGSETRIERVVIAGKRFSKTNEQEWVEEKGNVNGSGSGGISGKIREYSTTAKVEKDKGINGVKVDIYQVTRRSVFERSDGKTDISNSVSMYWIDKSGRLFRTQIKRQTQTGSDFSEVHSEWDFEYDANIKIEAPIK